MKKTISFILILACLVTSLAVVANASGTGVGVYINNTQFTGNVRIKDSTTFVGIRRFATSMYSDAKVTYNYSTIMCSTSTEK